VSKEIFLYSEDKKYKCGVELADSLDNFGCPDHSVMVLFEERENGVYIIAQAKDKSLKIEKNKQIADLEAKLAEKEHSIEMLNQHLTDKAIEIERLGEELAEKEKEIDKLEDKLHHYYEETLNKGICGLCDHLRGEYKADFAISQLEKAKDSILDFSNGYWRFFIKNGEQYMLYSDLEGCLNEYIDQPIKELKEKK
jgi:uncharacterized coiled-coil protein SlyX